MSNFKVNDISWNLHRVTGTDSLQNAVYSETSKNNHRQQTSRRCRSIPFSGYPAIFIFDTSHSDVIKDGEGRRGEGRDDVGRKCQALQPARFSWRRELFHKLCRSSYVVHHHCADPHNFRPPSVHNPVDTSADCSAFCVDSKDPYTRYVACDATY